MTRPCGYTLEPGTYIAEASLGARVPWVGGREHAQHVVRLQVRAVAEGLQAPVRLLQYCQLAPAPPHTYTACGVSPLASV